MTQLYSVQDLAVELKVSVTRIYHYIKGKKIVPDFILLQKDGKNTCMFYKKTIGSIASKYKKYKDSRSKANSNMPKL